MDQTTQRDDWNYHGSLLHWYVTSCVFKSDVNQGYVADMHAALLSGIWHYIFFVQLHDSIASGEQARISQTWVTAISLLLVTIFKASLLGGVGLSSTQYLWRVLRGKPLAVSTVESLFQMRQNPLELFNYRLILSVSFLLAMFTWTVPLAAIYPPTALTIDTTPFLVTERLPISVPEIAFSPDFDLLHPEKASRLAVFRMSRGSSSGGEESFSAELQRPLPFLLQYVQSVILGGEIVQKTVPPSGENATYLLDFMGPQLSCHEEKAFNRTVPKILDALNGNSSQAELVVLDLGNPTYTSNLGKLYYTCNTNSTCATVQSMESGLVWPITQSKVFASSLCASIETTTSNQTEVLYNYLLETTETKCRERYVSYMANVSYVKGIQSITYTTHDLDPQPLIPKGYGITWNSSIQESEVNYVMSDERSEIKTRLRYNNALTVYTAFWQVITSATRTICDAWPPSRCLEDWQSPNGTRMGIGPVDCRQEEGREYSLSPPCQPPKYAI